MDVMDRLERDIRALVPQMIAVSRENLGGAERVRVVRLLEDGSERYLLITWAGGSEAGLGPDTYSIIGGSSGNKDVTKNLDGRHWGTLAHTLTVVRKWLLDLCEHWTELPRPDRQA